MITPIPGSLVIPMLGVPSTLVSIDAHAVMAAVACVGASLVLAAVVMYLQRRSTPIHRPHVWDIVVERCHTVRHAA